MSGFDPYYKWLGIPLKDQPANHYRLLGIELFESDADVISSAADQRMAHVRCFQTGKNADVSQQVLNEIAAARVCLLNVDKKAEYDRQLRRRQAPPERVQPPPPRTVPPSVSRVPPVNGAPPVSGASAVGGLGFLEGSAAAAGPPGAPTLPPSKNTRLFLAAAGLMGAIVVLLLSVVLVVKFGLGGKETALGDPTPKSGKPVESANGPVIPGTEGPGKEPTPPTEQKPDAPPWFGPSQGPPKQESPKVPKQTTNTEPSGTLVEPAGVKPPVDDPREATPQPKVPAKLAVPSANELEKALATVREVFVAADKAALAKKLLEKAAETRDDPLSQFAMLQEARDVAAGSGDGLTAFQAVEAMAKEYQIDAAAMKAEILEKGAKAARSAPQRRVIALTALDVMDAAVADENFAIAKQMGKLATAEARQAKDMELVQRITGKSREIDAAAKAHAEVQDALQVLEKTPADPAANVIAGKYSCFSKRDWEKGLPQLALGNDATLKDLAQRDRNGATSPDEQKKLGDDWWQLAEQEHGSAKQNIQGRAAYWYRKASPNLTGLLRQSVDKRLADVGDPDKGGPRRPAVKLLSPFDSRKEASREAFLRAYGGNRDSEAAVQRGLSWLARHQMPDGGWSVSEFGKLCKGTGCSGPGDAAVRTGATALALLPFLAAGETHKTRGPYRKNVEGGLRWLTSKQKPNGDLRSGNGDSMYSHGLASIALCEAYGLSRDKALGQAAQQAVNFIQSAQHPSTGGWRYNPGDEGDTSVVGWQVAALKTAQMAGLSVSPQVLEKARSFLKSCSSGRGGQFSYLPRERSTPAMTAAGLLASQYLGVKRDNPILAEGMGVLMAATPDTGERNFYYWYYATQALHNAPGAEWDRWNGAMRQMLVDGQAQKECAAGSWDPLLPVKDPWARNGGRLYATSFALLTLEVYYRYPPLYDD